MPPPACKEMISRHRVSRKPSTTTTMFVNMRPRTTSITRRSRVSMRTSTPHTSTWEASSYSTRVSSSFLSLVAFTENGTSTIFPNSPDRSDTVFASFSLGYPLSAFGTHPVPTYVANSQIVPLTSKDSNHWTWGLNYTNLNAIWWRMYPDPLLPLWDASTPRAFAQYSQLSFNYALAIDPSAKTATLTTSYTVWLSSTKLRLVIRPTPAQA